MTEFIKICPHCGHENPEYENLCSTCGHFIAMENAVSKAAPLLATETTATSASAFYLHVEQNAQIFTVKPGWVIGQAHSSSSAQIQLPATLEGCEFVHRQHARFTYQEQRWYITPLDQQAFQRAFTNPSFLNQHPLTPGQSYAVQDGDRLVLSKIALLVKMVS